MIVARHDAGELVEVDDHAGRRSLGLQRSLDRDVEAYE